MRKTLSELFEIENKESSYINTEVSDYSVFKDKNLLDSLRNKIIQNKAEVIIEKAIENGGKDNATALVVEVKDD